MVFFNEGDSFAFTTSTFDTDLLRDKAQEYHVAMIDKPGLSFCDTIRTNERDPYKILENYSPPDYYIQNLSLDWRVQSARAVISFLIKNGYFNSTKIVVWGFSEGGQVVPKLAAEDKRITHVVSVVGSGLNQFYDNIISARIKVAKGEYTHQEAQSEVDGYLSTFKEIYKNPAATDRTFSGHTYKRWASFCAEDPFVLLTKLSIPIYMLAGSADNNSPIYGLDYVPLEFARLGKENLTYDVCIGCNHFQTVVETTDENLKGKSLGDAYRKKISLWLNSH
jgi:dienelactone hydrolase